MNYALAFTLIRLAMFLPLSGLFAAQLVNLMKRRGKKDDRHKTRLFLFIVTTAIWLEALIFFANDFTFYILGNTRQSFLQGHQWTLLVVRFIMLIGIWKGYFSIYGNTKSKRS